MRPRLLGGLLTAVFLLTGCGSPEPPPATDPASLEKLDQELQRAHQQEAGAKEPP